MKLQNFFKNKYTAIISNILIIIIGTFLMGIAYRVFLIPNKITPGGFSGLAAMISAVFADMNIFISPSIIYLLINIVLFAFFLKIFGWKLSLYAGLGILSFSLFMEFATISLFESSELIICAIFGGVSMGFGTGLVLRVGASTGGSDMLAIIVNRFVPTFNTGQIIIMVESIVIFLSIFVYGIQFTLYALVAIYISGRATDMVLDGIKNVRAYYIISNNPNQIAKEINNKLDRGVTRIKAEGTYTGQQRDILLCLVTRPQILSLKKIVKNIDENAFVFSVNVKEAMGEGFYKKPEKSILFKSRGNKLKKAKIDTPNLSFNESSKIISEQIDNSDK